MEDRQYMYEDLINMLERYNEIKEQILRIKTILCKTTVDHITIMRLNEKSKEKNTIIKVNRRVFENELVLLEKELEEIQKIKEEFEEWRKNEKNTRS